MSDAVLVIGGGIAGIQASLDLAASGARVILVEKEPTIGGIMAILDKNFPTLDCSICIEAPKMSEVDLHPNIEVFTQAEIESVTGEPGDFSVQIRQNARFITNECTRCADCTEACPVVLPNSFDAGLGSRKAIYSPIPQAVPGTYVVDIENCLNDPPNYMPCSRCIDACKPGAIDFLMPKEQQFSVQVAAIIVAVGYGMLDPGLIREYGYGSHPDILTALEFERLVNSAGPTAGEILCPSNGRHPDSALFVLCVGSRDRRFFRHCSRFCCMYSLKHAYQAIDHGLADITVLNMDLRAFGKGFDSFLNRVNEAGAKFIRGRPSRIQGGPEGVTVVYENLDQGRRIEQKYDLVVLANAVTPAPGLLSLAHRLGIELDGDGFIKSDELRGGLVTSSRPGIYVAGCASGPKDIPDSVAEASGAAGLALSHLSSRYWHKDPAVELPPLEAGQLDEPRIGVFVCHCGSNIAGVIDVKEVVSRARKLPSVVHATDQMFSCAGNTQGEIEEAIRDENINRLVVAACSPKTHEAIFRGVLKRAGVNQYLIEMANLRNMDSWVHKFDPVAATEKAVDMVAMAVEKAGRLIPREANILPVTKRVMVVGGGISGMTAAASLARQGFETHLIEQKNHLGGVLDELDEIAPTQNTAQDYLVLTALELVEKKVNIHLGETVETITGVVGNFAVSLSDNSHLQVGAIIVATGAEPYQPTEFNYGSHPGVLTNLEVEQRLTKGTIDEEQITFVSCVGSRQENLGCSRYCCTAMINQAIRLRRLGKEVRVVSRDIRTYSRQAEELYEIAMRAIRKWNSEHLRSFPWRADQNRYRPTCPGSRSQTQ